MPAQRQDLKRPGDDQQGSSCQPAWAVREQEQQRESTPLLARRIAGLSRLEDDRERIRDRRRERHAHPGGDQT